MGASPINFVEIISNMSKKNFPKKAKEAGVMCSNRRQPHMGLPFYPPTARYSSMSLPSLGACVEPRAIPEFVG